MRCISFRLCRERDAREGGWGVGEKGRRKDRRNEDEEGREEKSVEGEGR